MLSRSRRFLNQLETILENHLNETTFSVTKLSQAMEISGATLRRKTQQYTGLSPNLYIRKFRLEKATELLENDTGTVSEIAGAVGFSTPSYFAKCFQEQFGMLPSLYRSKQSKGKKGNKILAHPVWKTDKEN